MVIGVKVVHRLFDGVVGMIGSLGDNSESCCSVVIVRAVGVEVPEVILQQQLVLGQSLYRLQEIVGHFQVATLGEVLKLLQSQKSKSGKLFPELLHLPLLTCQTSGILSSNPQSAPL